MRELQRKLHLLGLLSSADLATGPGVFGPRTEAAVLAFQTEHGIKRTGVVGAYTQAALHQAIAERTGALRMPALPTGTIPFPTGRGYVGHYDGQHPAPGTTDTRAWVPVEALVRSHTGNRSAARYDDVLNQFAVAHNPRYEARPGQDAGVTFVSDVTRAMSAELPRQLNGRSLDANGMIRWLHERGGAHGWKLVDARTAQAWANAGRPAIASWPNPGGAGHIALVRPGRVTDAGPVIAQAGSKRFNRGHVAEGFGTQQPEYWVHA